MEPGAIFRAYRMATDRSRLREIYLASRREAFHWLDPEAFVLDDFDRDTRGESILVAELDGFPIGFSSTWPAERFVHHLYLDPEYLRQGHGSRLLAETIRAFGEPMRLKCLAQNTRALRFYLEQGWRVVGRDQGEHGEFCELEYRRRNRNPRTAAREA